MAASPRLWVFLAAATLAVVGLALGAASQEELFLQAYGAKDPDGPAAGNLVLLTALLAALGAGAAGFLAGRGRSARRAGLAGLLAVAVYVSVLLVQSAWPNYDAIEETRQARLAINPMVHNAEAAPSTVTPLVGLILAGALTSGWCLQGLLSGRRKDGPGTPERLLGRHVAAQALAASVLGVTAVGVLGVLVHMLLVGKGLAHVPLLIGATAATAGLVATQVAKTWHLAAFVRNARLGGIATRAWHRLGRIEGGLVVLLAATALGATFLPRTDLAAVELGLTLRLTARSHGQGLLLALVALVPAYLVHRSALPVLEHTDPGRYTLESDALQPVVLATTAAALASVAGAAFALVALEGALWPWLFGTLPWAVVTLRYGEPVRGALCWILLSLVLWGIGNTVAAGFDGRGDGSLHFVTSIEVLSLWRVAAAVSFGVAVVRMLGPASTGLRASLRYPMLLGAALSLGALGLLELPLTAWVQQSAIRGEEVGVGSVVSSQDPSVQWVMHGLALLGAVVAAGILARLHRPDWFQRPRGAPSDAPVGVGA